MRQWMIAESTMTDEQIVFIIPGADVDTLAMCAELQDTLDTITKDLGYKNNIIVLPPGSDVKSANCELEQYHFLREVMMLLYKSDEAYCESAFWHVRNDVVTICFNVNDTFAYACADAEPIETTADLDLLKQCIADIGCDTDAGYVDGWMLGMLYTARRRGIKPLAVMFSKDHVNHGDCIPDRLHHLFEGLQDN
jgi:hypothetical protein